MTMAWHGNLSDYLDEDEGKPDINRESILQWSAEVNVPALLGAVMGIHAFAHQPLTIQQSLLQQMSCQTQTEDIGV